MIEIYKTDSDNKLIQIEENEYMDQKFDQND